MGHQETPDHSGQHTPNLFNISTGFIPGYVMTTQAAARTSGAVCNEGLSVRKNYQAPTKGSSDHTREHNKQDLPSWTLHDLRTPSLVAQQSSLTPAARVRSQLLSSSPLLPRSVDSRSLKNPPLSFSPGEIKVLTGIWCSEVGQEPCAECQQSSLRARIWI